MTLRIEESISEEKRESGKVLYELLNQISNEHKRALIWFRCNEGEIPSDVNLDDDVEYARVEATLNALGNFGTVYVDEHDFIDVVEDIYEENEDVLEDGEAWDVLTRIEVANYENYDNYYFESYLYEDGDQKNDIGIDLVGANEVVELVTCKYNISTQHASASRRLSELENVRDSINNNSSIVLGTLAFKLDSAIVGDLSQHMSDSGFSENNIDKIVTGIHIFDLDR